MLVGMTTVVQDLEKKTLTVTVTLEEGADADLVGENAIGSLLNTLVARRLRLYGTARTEVLEPVKGLRQVVATVGYLGELEEVPVPAPLPVPDIPPVSTKTTAKDAK